MPVAVTFSVVEAPEVIVRDVGETVTAGAVHDEGFAVTDLLSVIAWPLAFVPVTVSVTGEADGVKVTLEPVAEVPPPEKVPLVIDQL